MRAKALTTARASERMNGLESRYAAHLEALRLAGKIARWDFQPVKFRLADNTFYTPDFRVIRADGLEEFHETKGFMREDANVKLKVAAEMHPYKFVLVREIKRRFELTEYP